MEIILVLKFLFVILRTHLAVSEKIEDQQAFLGFGDCKTKEPDLVSFHLYPSSVNANYSEEIKFGDQNSLRKSNFTSTKSLLIIIHGFLNNYTTIYSQSMKNAYLQNGFEKEYNIILVDWGKLARPCSSNNLLKDMQYPFAVINVPTVGQRVAEFIIFLLKATKTLNFQNVHIVGFSLGAHVSGITGDYIKHNTSQSVGRITGLDPAGPLFGMPVPYQYRLKSSDAAFTNVVHTDMGEYGIIEAIGHADFYANSGFPNQPGCSPNEVTSSASCSHNRAWIYYVHALYYNIIACKCSDYISYKYSCKGKCPNSTLFGENTPPTARGKYFFDLSL